MNRPSLLQWILLPPLLALVHAGLFASTCGAEEKAALRTAGPLWQQIEPVLTKKCLTCHGSDKQKGKLNLTRHSLAVAGGKSGPALVPGKPAESLLYQKLAAGEMPPQNPLSPEQVEAFKAWIETGAKYDREPLTALVQRAGPDWWSLQPVRHPALPQVSDRAWLRTPIDSFILAKLNEKGLRPSPEADRATLIRRACFDLLGLPPTPEEVRAFIDDPSPNAYEKLIDRLLASPHYGERWARHWLDVVRFAESNGYETNVLRSNAWPYRDYVIRAFNEDLPYPQFMLEQLAGDVVGRDWLAQAATGFLVGGAHDVVGNQTVEGMLQQRMDDLDDMIATTGATFLGLTVNCARCHDHKFDPIAQRDYYGLQAVFAGVQHAERDIPPPDAERRKREAAQIEAALAQLDRQLDELEPIIQSKVLEPRRAAVNARRNVERFVPVEARYVRFTITATNDKAEPCLDELEIYKADSAPDNIALAAAGAKALASSTFAGSSLHKLEHLNDGRYGNSQSWISREPGHGWVQIELPRAVKINRIVWGRDREEKFKDRLATEYRIEIAPEPGKWQTVASSADRLPFQSGSQTTGSAAHSSEQERQRCAELARHKQLQERLATLRETSKVYAGSFTQPGPTNVLMRGDPMQKGDRVVPCAPTVVRPTLTINAGAPETERRLALARWLGNPENPLPARVMVNRLWHYHFGQGIVATPSDFGYNGDRPSHPELLDWLASEYVRCGWRFKPLHRLIVLSAAYRQSSRPEPRASAVDQQDRLLWRVAPRRLEAEALRDAMLSVSGQFDQRMGGPGYEVWEKNTNYVVVFKPKQELGPDEFRRMVYQFKPRSQQDPTFGLFDCPDAALAKPRRTVSTTALQALNLLNGRFVLAQADLFRQRLKKEVGEDAKQQVNRAFELALGRAPSPSEEKAALALVQSHGIAAFCRALFNANEFLYVD